MLKAAAAAETVFLFDFKRLPRLDTALRTMFHTCPAADTIFCNLITLFYNPAAAEGITLSENRVNIKIEIFNLTVFNHKNNTDVSCITRINIGQIRLFLKNNI